MAKYRSLTVLPLTALGLICTSFLGLPSHAASNDIGNKGATVYCFMRNTGNSHKVSWDASYEIIKRQKSSFFKTSPKHAAVMIIETVVQNPEQYKNCGNYLGDLFSPENSNPIQEEMPAETEPSEPNPSKVKKGDRYSY